MIISIVKDGQTLVPLHQYEGKQVQIKEYRKSRSLDQNAYFHGPVLKYICEHTGDERLWMKYYLKARFAPVIVVSVDGETKEYPKNTSDMNVKEMSKFIDDCVRFAATELSVTIPPPPYAV